MAVGYLCFPVWVTVLDPGDVDRLAVESRPCQGLPDHDGSQGQ
jgi:hypothetical protein